MHDETTIRIVGGPMCDSDAESVFIRSLRRHAPPYFCHRPAGQQHYHHYATGSDEGVYVYMGRCNDIPHKHGQPHEHLNEDAVDEVGRRLR